jgi:hypothetical protein
LTKPLYIPSHNFAYQQNLFSSLLKFNLLIEAFYFSIMLLPFGKTYLFHVELSPYPCIHHNKTNTFSRRCNHVSCLYKVNLDKNEIKFCKIQLRALKDFIIWSPWTMWWSKHLLVATLLWWLKKNLAEIKTKLNCDQIFLGQNFKIFNY